MPIGTGNRFQPWNRRSNEVIERELGDKLDLPDPISRFFSLAQTLSRFFIVLEDSFEFLFFIERKLLRLFENKSVCNGRVVKKLEVMSILI